MLKLMLPTVLMLILLTACDYNNKVYDHYVEANTEGWEKNEPIVFGIDTLQESGMYSLILGLRISDKYPFQNLQMVIDQTVYPSRQKIHDVIECKVTNRQGVMLGHGVSMYQYDLPIRQRLFQKGDSISVRVRHNMKREILPGILDVGVTLKKDNNQ